jgi:hypothetical protein
MEKEFVKYMEALALKELGFDEPCFAWYVSEKYGLEFGKVIQSHLIGDAVVAPTYSQAFRFFRENYGLCQIVIQNTDKDWTYEVWAITGITYYEILDVLDEYEESEQDCLKKLIEIVKEK